MSASAPGARDRPHERLDAPVVAAQLQDLVHDRAVLALQLARELGRRRDVRPRLDRDAEDARLVRGALAGQRPVQRHEHHRVLAPHPHALRHLGDHADLRVRAVLERQQQHVRVGADVHRQRHRHAGEDDQVVERNDPQVLHEKEDKIDSLDCQLSTSVSTMTRGEARRSRVLPRLAAADEVLLRPAPPPPGVGRRVRPLPGPVPRTSSHGPGPARADGAAWPRPCRATPRT